MTENDCVARTRLCLRATAWAYRHNDLYWRLFDVPWAVWHGDSLCSDVCWAWVGSEMMATTEWAASVVGWRARARLYGPEISDGQRDYALFAARAQPDPRAEASTCSA